MMRQLRALGKKIRVPEARMNEIRAKSLPTLMGLRDAREHRDRMHKLELRKLASRKDLAERSLSQSAKDAKKARQLMYGKIGADIALGVGGAYMAGGDDTTNDVVTPAISNVLKTPSTDTIDDVTSLKFLPNENTPTQTGGLKFISDSVEPVTEGIGGTLKKFAGDIYSGAGDLYANTIGKLFEFDTPAADTSNIISDFV